MCSSSRPMRLDPECGSGDGSFPCSEPSPTSWMLPRFLALVIAASSLMPAYQCDDGGADICLGPISMLAVPVGQMILVDRVPSYGS